MLFINSVNTKCGIPRTIFILQRFGGLFYKNAASKAGDRELPCRHSQVMTVNSASICSRTFDGNAGMKPQTQTSIKGAGQGRHALYLSWEIFQSSAKSEFYFDWRVLKLVCGDAIM